MAAKAWTGLGDGTSLTVSVSHADCLQHRAWHSRQIPKPEHPRGCVSLSIP
eukprot:SAG31_NODE_27261_length_429_cov_0.678788_1_plen_50_part_01